MPEKNLKMTDERNFRSSYYEKVGCRGVEEKKSLEILMKEKPWDRVKLKQFCLRFTVPAAYRNLVWKVLLGKYFYSLLPPYTGYEDGKYLSISTLTVGTYWLLPISTTYLLF